MDLLEGGLRLFSCASSSSSIPVLYSSTVLFTPLIRSYAQSGKTRHRSHRKLEENKGLFGSLVVTDPMIEILYCRFLIYGFLACKGLMIEYNKNHVGCNDGLKRILLHATKDPKS